MGGLPKRDTIRSYASLAGISEQGKWEKIIPDLNFDWIDQVDSSFAQFPVLGDKKAKFVGSIFENYSLGVNSNRDSWVYNADRSVLRHKMSEMAHFYNSEVERQRSYKNVANDPKKIKWSSSLESSFKKGKLAHYSDGYVRTAVFKLFEKTNLYFDPMFIHRMAQIPKIFPAQGAKNLVIQVSGVGARAGFAAMMFDCPPTLDTIEKGQCFPLKLYEPASADDSLFATGETGYTERDGISDAGLKHFQDTYAGEQISKEDLFYYIYGLLHSPDYRARFKNNLSKELPRIPAVKTAADFWAFSKAGRTLGDLHVNYETVELYPCGDQRGRLALGRHPRCRSLLPRRKDEVRRQGQG